MWARNRFQLETLGLCSQQRSGRQSVKVQINKLQKAYFCQYYFTLFEEKGLFRQAQHSRISYFKSLRREFKVVNGKIETRGLFGGNLKFNFQKISTFLSSTCYNRNETKKFTNDIRRNIEFMFIIQSHQNFR